MSLIIRLDLLQKAQIIDEEIEGQPWNLEHWFIGSLNEVQVCGGCCWIEAQKGDSDQP